MASATPVSPQSVNAPESTKLPAKSEPSRPAPTAAPVRPDFVALGRAYIAENRELFERLAKK